MNTGHGTPWTADELYNLICYAREQGLAPIDVLLYPLPNVEMIPITCVDRTDVAIRSAWFRFRAWSLWRCTPENAFERACAVAYDKYMKEDPVVSVHNKTTETPTNDLSAAKVGDRIFSVRRGWCVVVKIESGRRLPIYMRRENSSDMTLSCTVEGLEYVGDAYPTFFWDKVNIIPPPCPKKPLPDLALDTPVFIRKGPQYKPAHFKGWAGGRTMCVFSLGRTSHTSKGTYEFCSTWKLQDGTTNNDYVV